MNGTGNRVAIARTLANRHDLPDGGGRWPNRLRTPHLAEVLEKT